MHICYIGDASSVHVHRWCAHLVDGGHTVSVITDVPGRVQGVEVYNVGDCLPPVRVPGVTAGFQIMSKVRHIRKIIRVIRPDIVHGHYATNYGFLAAMTGFQPLVQTVHGSDVLVDAKGSWEQRWFVRHALRRAVRITVVAEHMADPVLAMGIPESRIMVHQYGVDVDRFSPAPDKRRPLRVVSTRMFDWKYNLQDLVRAVPVLRSRVSDCEVLLAGDGPDRDEIVRLIEQLGVGASVTVLGKQSHDAVRDLLQTATVYVSTSVTDGTSLSLLEAMACGVFPVVSDIPGNRFWIEDGTNGFLFPKDKPELLADRISRAMEDEVLRAEVVDRNLDLVRTRGAYTDSMQIMEEEYRRLLA